MIQMLQSSTYAPGFRPGADSEINKLSNYIYFSKLIVIMLICFPWCLVLVSNLVADIVCPLQLFQVVCSVPVLPLHFGTPG